MISLWLGRCPILHEKPPVFDFDECQRYGSCYLQTTDFQSDYSYSISTIWYSWLQEHGLSHLQDSEPSFDSSLLGFKGVELHEIINGLGFQRDLPKSCETAQYQSQHWVDVTVNELNAKLLRWHSTLPGELRWNRWGSSSEVVNPRVAALQ